MIQLILKNSHNDQYYDLSSVVKNISWQTSYKGRASVLTVSLVSNEINTLTNGSTITFKYKNKSLFRGYVFSVDLNNNKEITITAYDQIRYLMMRDTMKLKNKRADQIIKQIATQRKLKLGEIANTKHVIGPIIRDGQTLLDIIYYALKLTKENTGQEYIFYDDFGKLNLKHTQKMQLALVLGKDSLMTNYNYKKSIDRDTYNKIEMIKSNGEKEPRVVCSKEDSSNINLWGTLLYLEEVKENQNKSQIINRAKELLKLKNRELQSLTIDALGDSRVRAGNSIYINIDQLQNNIAFLVESCNHKFTQSQHTMNLSLRVI